MGDGQTMKEKIMAILMLLCTLPVVYFEKDITVVIGEPISYKLDEDEIVQKWCAEICKNTGFENCMLNPENV